MEPKKDYKVDPRREDHLGLYSSPIRRWLSGFRLRALSRALHQSTAPGANVLEVGCGHGEVLEACYRPDITLTGVDINPVSVNIARKRFAGRRNVTLHEADVRALNFADASFDGILCTEVIEHIPDPRILLNEIDRLLKPGGAFISTVPWEHLLFLLRALTLPVRFLKGRDLRVPEHLHDFTLSSYRRLLEETFTVTDIRRIEFGIRIFAVCGKKKG